MMLVVVLMLHTDVITPLTLTQECHVCLQNVSIGQPTLHCPLGAFKTFFQFMSQTSTYNPKRSKYLLPLDFEVSRSPKTICEVVTFGEISFADWKKTYFS